MQVVFIRALKNQHTYHTLFSHFHSLLFYDGNYVCPLYLSWARKVNIATEIGILVECRSYRYTGTYTVKKLCKISRKNNPEYLYPDSRNTAKKTGTCRVKIRMPFIPTSTV